MILLKTVNFTVIENLGKVCMIDISGINEEKTILTAEMIKNNHGHAASKLYIQSFYW